ncbi:hypothetical protein M011DRAFT_183013 [Sporormia fimetaria CBS 119925]|uniref:Uncharacterized protein n=1 Tax=Sporormia fimetaria CBS 119925 TaxID=1340428 RepID=A0A6A6VLU1_9PLEO|nr:hypothetical protein M011DRAFT_183013 [Sporormia fimetaria CBS 119925]
MDRYSTPPTLSPRFSVTHITEVEHSRIQVVGKATVDLQELRVHFQEARKTEKEVDEKKMCYHILWIYDICGHSRISAWPVRKCSEIQARDKPNPNSTKTEIAEMHQEAQRSEENSKISHTLGCTSDQAPSSSSQTRGPEGEEISVDTCPNLHTHPYQTRLVHTLCPDCAVTRNRRLEELRMDEICFKPWRWKVRYSSPEPEEARFVGLGGVQGWGEVMGSWVGRVGEGLGVDLMGGGKSDGPGRERAAEGGKRDVRGVRGGVGSM